VSVSLAFIEHAPLGEGAGQEGPGQDGGKLHQTEPRAAIGTGGTSPSSDCHPLPRLTYAPATTVLFPSALSSLRKITS
jgi:hypothetical protein